MLARITPDCVQIRYEADFVHQTTMMEHDLAVAPGELRIVHAASAHCPLAEQPHSPRIVIKSGRTYQYYTGKPVVPFGFGLSLSRWTTALPPAAASNLTLPTAGGAGRGHTIELVVTNHGPLVGDLVILAFLVPCDTPRDPHPPPTHGAAVSAAFLTLK